MRKQTGEHLFGRSHMGEWEERRAVEADLGKSAGAHARIGIGTQPARECSMTDSWLLHSYHVAANWGWEPVTNGPKVKPPGVR